MKNEIKKVEIVALEDVLTNFGVGEFILKKGDTAVVQKEWADALKSMKLAQEAKKNGAV